jgi:DNA-binding response OmpR family regulator
MRRYERVGRPEPAQAALQVGDLSIDPVAHTVSLAGTPVELSPREFELLYTLALEPQRVFSVDELLRRAWGAEFIGQPQVVYVHIRWLRQKIEANPNRPRRILTVRGVGYKLVP